MSLPIDFSANPLVPAVIQDDETRDVLMVGFMNQLAFESTLETGFIHFWSRSRNKLWKKGETSGHTQEVVSITLNCEENSLLIQVMQTGAVCHTGHRTCYYRQVLPDGTLFETSDPVFDPAQIYGPARLSPEALWYGAYEFLRDHDLSIESRTSRMLHADQPAPFERIADELEELAGVLSGEHVHQDFESDLLLEGSQVLYWIAVCAVGARLDASTDLRLSAGLKSRTATGIEDWVIGSLATQAATWRDMEPSRVEQELRHSIWLIGEAVGVAGVDPMRLIEEDLIELRSKPYLQDYFSSSTT